MSEEKKIDSLNKDIDEIIDKIREKIKNINPSINNSPDNLNKVSRLNDILKKLTLSKKENTENYNTYYAKIMSILPSSYKRQLIGLNLTRTNNNPIVELLAKGIAFILKYTNQLFNMLKNLLDDGIISDFEEKGLYSTNAIPGLFTVLIVIFLIIFLIWSSIQSFLKWISGGFINLPDLPISLDKRYTQFVYSFFHLLVSGYLVFVIFISYFRDLLEKAGLGTDNTTTTEEEISKNLDIIEIGKRIIQALYLLWIIAIVLIGSTIAKAFYKMACNGANTNIDSFAKIIDSSVVLTLIVSIILIILLKIKDFFNLVVKFFSGNVSKLKQYYENITKGVIFSVHKKTLERQYNKLNESPEDPKNNDEVERSQKILELIFNFDVIYFVLRVITLMYEEFASDNLVFLLGRMGEESPLNNCNPDGDDCDKDNFKETLKNFISGAVLWIVSLIVLFIQFKIPKNPTNDLDKTIGDNIKNLLEAFVAMLDSNKGSGDKNKDNKDNKSFKDYFTELKTNISKAKDETKTGLPRELKERSKQAANKTGKLAKTTDKRIMDTKIYKEDTQYEFDKARYDVKKAKELRTERLKKDNTLVQALAQASDQDQVQNKAKILAQAQAKALPRARNAAKQVHELAQNLTGALTQATPET